MRFTTSTLMTAVLFAVPALSAPVEKRGIGDNTIIYDDYPGPGVTYYPSPDWINLVNQGEYHQNRTGSYTGVQNAEVRFDLPSGLGNITHVTVYSTKKADRGDASIYCGTSLVGVFSEYDQSTTETNSGTVFSQDVSTCSLANGSAPYIVVKNDRGAQYLAIDALEIEYSGAGAFQVASA